MNTVAPASAQAIDEVAAAARRVWRPAAVFGVCFAGLLALLLVRNTGVFTLHVAERGDSAANSIIVAQAKHFQLLVGNYSRVGFSHPGPAYFYLCALGEWLGYDVLGVLPSPYNGQWLATLVLNAALVAAALTVLWTWVRSRRALLWTAAAALAVIASHGSMLSSTWMPNVYVAPYLLFLTAAASVAAGRTRHAWLVVLAGGLLVHGHAEFLLLFVPATALAVAAVLAYRRRRGVPQPWVWRHWLAALPVAAVFAFPMVLDLVLHWPGEYPRYVSYGHGHRILHGVTADARYLLVFWAHPAGLGALVMVLLFAGAALVARRQPDAQLRRFLLTTVGMVALSTALFAAYVAAGIDHLDPYVGYFFWAAPMLLLLALVLGLAAWWRPGGRVGTLLAAAGLCAALVFATVSPALRIQPEQLRAGPAAVRALRAYAAGRPAVLSLQHDRWPVMTALLIDAERGGQRLCVRDRYWQFMVTSQLVCRPREVATGVPVALVPQPDGQSVSVVFGGMSIPLPEQVS